MSGYYLHKDFIPSYHSLYPTDSDSVDLETLREPIIAEFPDITKTTLTNFKFKDTNGADASLSGISYNMMKKPWVMSIGSYASDNSNLVYDGYSYIDQYGNDRGIEYILKGTLPTFGAKIFEYYNETSATVTGSIEWKLVDKKLTAIDIEVQIGNEDRITRTTYTANDFRGGIIPTTLIVELQGGGGGGGASYYSNSISDAYFASGGGGGGYAIAVISFDAIFNTANPTQNTKYSFDVGSGGAGSNYPTTYNGGNGGPTWIYSHSGTPCIKAEGGKGGKRHKQSEVGGNPGTVSINTACDNKHIWVLYSIEGLQGTEGDKTNDDNDDKTLSAHELTIYINSKDAQSNLKSYKATTTGDLGQKSYTTADKTSGGGGASRLANGGHAGGNVLVDGEKCTSDGSAGSYGSGGGAGRYASANINHESSGGNKYGNGGKGGGGYIAIYY